MDLSPLGKLIPTFGSPTLEGLDYSNAVNGQRVSAGSSRQFVRFYKKIVPTLSAKKVKINEKTGEVRVLEHEIVDVEREFVEIVTPGDKNTVDDFAQDFHRREHWEQYRAFRDGRTAPIGEPIEECSFVPSHIATELKYLKVHTVEQLAEASDILCDRVANGHQLREHARAVVKAKNSSKSLEQVNALKSELDRAMKMIAELQGQRNGAQPVEAVSKGKRGRPKKVQIDEPQGGEEGAL